LLATLDLNIVPHTHLSSGPRAAGEFQFHRVPRYGDGLEVGEPGTNRILLR
jgi:hypothetical protein